jgi:hypothetical protein
MMNRSPEAEFALLLELLNAQEALDEHRRTTLAAAVRSPGKGADHNNTASREDVLEAFEQALTRAREGET